MKKKDIKSIIMEKVTFIDQPEKLFAEQLEQSLHWEKTDLSKAAEFAQQALETARLLASLELQKQALTRLGILQQKQKLYEDAIKSHLQLLKICHSLQEDNSVLTVYKSLGIDYWNLKNYKMSLEYFQKYHLLAQELRDQDSEINALNLLGNVYWALCENKNSLESFLKLIELTGAKDVKSSTDSCYRNEIFQATNNIGNIYADLCDYQKALEYFLQALAMSPVFSDKEAEAKILNNIALLYESLNSQDDAKRYHLKALAIRTEIADKMGIAHSLNNIGLIYKHENDLELALQYFLESTTLKTEINDLKGAANSMSNIASIYIQTNEPDKALEYIRKSLQNYMDLGNKDGIATTYMLKGEYFQLKYDFRSARKYFKKSLPLVLEIGNKEMIKNNYNDLYQLELQCHNYKQALTYCEKYHSVEVEIFNENSISKIAELKIKFEIEQMEKETEIFRQKNEELADALEKLKLLNENLEQRVETGIAELRKKDSLMIAQSRQATMGQMIGFIAHQWRQPLNIINIIAQNLEDAFKYNELNEESLHRNVTDICNQITLMSQTINDFRNFFKPLSEKTFFSLNEVIPQTIRFVERSFINNNIRINLELAEDCSGEGLPNEFSQVILNLLNNSREAFAEVPDQQDKEVTIRLFKENGKSVITFKDNAGGIPAEILPRIFESYFSTKSSENGTGLGLFMCKTIIEERMNGKITVSNTTRGAKFRLEI
ncbi:MAG: tetratricopeptide repeat-containing sensor histidine kinase [Candidatus Cloacimonetes bacterium]|nr:tetratricopeptide repeat-containing sensor histidine kinase [Candidatus Cloacimonadota bacterium]